jgi:hypothetical protein
MKGGQQQYGQQLSMDKKRNLQGQKAGTTAIEVMPAMTRILAT